MFMFVLLLLEGNCARRWRPSGAASRLGRARARTLKDDVHGDCRVPARLGDGDDQLASTHGEAGHGARLDADACMLAPGDESRRGALHDAGHRGRAARGDRVSRAREHGREAGLAPAVRAGGRLIQTASRRREEGEGCRRSRGGRRCPWRRTGCSSSRTAAAATVIMGSLRRRRRPPPRPPRRPGRARTSPSCCASCCRFSPGRAEWTRARAPCARCSGGGRTRRSSTCRSSATIPRRCSSSAARCSCGRSRASLGAWWSRGRDCTSSRCGT